MVVQPPLRSMVADEGPALSDAHDIMSVGTYRSSQPYAHWLSIACLTAAYRPCDRVALQSELLLKLLDNLKPIHGGAIHLVHKSCTTQSSHHSTAQHSTAQH